MQARLWRAEERDTTAGAVTFLSGGAGVTDLLYDPVFAGGEVVFGCIDEGNPEVEQQINDQGAGVLRQEDLKKRS